MSDPKCPTCGFPVDLRILALEREIAMLRASADAVHKAASDNAAEASSLRAKLSAEQTAHAATRKALEEADEALIRAHESMLRPDAMEGCSGCVQVSDQEWDCEGHYIMDRVFNENQKPYQAALARSTQRKENR